jgi:hypothetical protein
MPDNPTTDLTGEELTILSFGATDDGAMADPIADATMECCEGLLQRGLLQRGAPIDYIRTYFTTAAGLVAMGRTVN